MIAVQIASNTEWQAVCDLYDISVLHGSPYGPYFDTEIKGINCRIYYSGYSKTKAAGAAQYAISKWSVSRLFVCGTCGGVSSALHPEDIIIATETVFYDCIDRFTQQDDPFFPYLDTHLPQNKVDNPLNTSVHYGRIATGDQDIDLLVRNSLEPLGVLAADWESASVAHICALNEVPLIVIRGVSDIPGYQGASISEQAESYYTRTPRIMETICNHILPQLV